MTNYVYVDDENGITRVYDSHGTLEPREFDDASRVLRRWKAETYAKAEATLLGCEWGTNYDGAEAR